MDTESKLISVEEMQALSQAMPMAEPVAKEIPFDPRRGSPFGAREQELRLRQIHADIATSASESLNHRMQTRISRISLDHQSDDPVVFAQFQEDLATSGPACINILDLNSIGAGLLTFDLTTSFRFIDLCLGGNGKVDVPGRKFFTDIESATLDEIVALVLSGLKRGWDRFLPEFNPTFTQREFDPKLITIWSSTERVISSSFNIVSDIFAGEMRLCLPYAKVTNALSQYSPEAEEEEAFENHAIEPALEARLQKVPLTLTAILGIAQVSVRELLDLKVGGLIPLETPITRPLYMQVEGKTKFSARLGLVGNKYGLKVEE
ncbi:MAG: FliM/FliN family flagellar motor switch protein, partial [Planctomycetota bacterium]|nr:FliM/FliN family flagellar motor switch protein [Planctomycetota bacterium]